MMGDITDEQTLRKLLDYCSRKKQERQEKRKKCGDLVSVVLQKIREEERKPQADAVRLRKLYLAAEKTETALFTIGMRQKDEAPEEETASCCPRRYAPYLEPYMPQYLQNLHDAGISRQKAAGAHHAAAEEAYGYAEKRRTFFTSLERQMNYELAQEKEKPEQERNQYKMTYLSHMLFAVHELGYKSRKASEWWKAKEDELEQAQERHDFRSMPKIGQTLSEEYNRLMDPGTPAVAKENRVPTGHTASFDRYPAARTRNTKSRSERDEEKIVRYAKSRDLLPDDDGDGALKERWLDAPLRAKCCSIIVYRHEKSKGKLTEVQLQEGYRLERSANLLDGICRKNHAADVVALVLKNDSLFEGPAEKEGLDALKPEEGVFLGSRDIEDIYLTRREYLERAETAARTFAGRLEGHKEITADPSYCQHGIVMVRPAAPIDGHDVLIICDFDKRLMTPYIDGKQASGEALKQNPNLLGIVMNLEKTAEGKDVREIIPKGSGG